MSTVGVRSHRRFSDNAVRAVLDLTLVNTAYLGGLFLNEALVEYEPLRVHAKDVPAFLTLSCIFAAVSKIGGLQKQPMAVRRALSSVPFVVITFVVLALLRLLLPHDLTFSFPTLGMSTVLGILFIVGSRTRPRAAPPSLETKANWLSQQEMKVERILIIGGAGHIGSLLVPELLANGYRVRVLDKLPLGNEGRSMVSPHRNFELICGDFRDLNTVVRAMSGMDTVVHLGGAISDPGYEGNDELTVEVNNIATRLIGSCAKAVNIRRFIFASSCSVYGPSIAVADETSCLQPKSLYGRVKAESEAELQAISSNKFQPIILRFGAAYGLGAGSRFNNVVSYLATSSQASPDLILDVPDCEQPFIHVQDILRAITLALQSPAREVCGEVFNVGSECEIRNLVAVAELVRFQTQFTNLKIAKCSPESVGLRVEFSKIRSRLGFKAMRSLEDGIEEIVEATLTGRIQPTTLVSSEEHVLSEDLGLSPHPSHEPSHSHPAKTLLI